MLIEFSRDLSGDFLIAADWRYAAVEFAAQFSKAVKPNIKWARRSHNGINRIRFELPGASVKQHDDFINAMFRIDPWARIRTAIADYNGADDFLAQKAARV